MTFSPSPFAGMGRDVPSHPTKNPISQVSWGAPNKQTRVVENELRGGEERRDGVWCNKTTAKVGRKTLLSPITAKVDSAKVLCKRLVSGWRRRDRKTLPKPLTLTVVLPSQQSPSCLSFSLIRRDFFSPRSFFLFLVVCLPLAVFGNFEALGVLLHPPSFSIPPLSPLHPPHSCHTPRQSRDASIPFVKREGDNAISLRQTFVFLRHFLEYSQKKGRCREMRKIFFPFLGISNPLQLHLSQTPPHRREAGIARLPGLW